MDRAQGLPISTIVLVVIGVIILAAILLFFFTGFAGSKSVMSGHQFSSKCQDMCASVNAKDPTDLADAKETLSKFGWCENHTVSSIGETTCASFAAGCHVEVLDRTVCSSCEVVSDQAVCGGCDFVNGEVSCD